MSKIKLDKDLKREIIVKCKNEYSKKVTEKILRMEFCKNSDYLNNRITVNPSKDDNTVSLCFSKDCENIPDFKLTCNSYAYDYIDSIIIKCYKNDAKRLSKSIYNQICESEDYMEQNISLIDCYNRRYDTIDEIYLIYNNPCKDLPDFIIEGDFNKNKNSYLVQKIYDYMMKTSGRILELSEDRNMKVYLYEELNIIASNMAEFANNILKESANIDLDLFLLNFSFCTDVNSKNEYNKKENN